MKASGGQGDAVQANGSSKKQTRVHIMVSLPPGQTRMECDGTPDNVGMNPYLQLFWEPGNRG